MASTIPMAGTGSAPGMMAQSNGAPPTSPLNFLIAAADQSSGGSDPHRSAPVPKGHALPAFTKSSGKHPAPPIKVVK